MGSYPFPTNSYGVNDADLVLPPINYGGSPFLFSFVWFTTSKSLWSRCSHWSQGSDGRHAGRSIPGRDGATPLRYGDGGQRNTFGIRTQKKKLVPAIEYGLAAGDIDVGRDRPSLAGCGGCLAGLCAGGERLGKGAAAALFSLFFFWMSWGGRGRKS